MIVRARGIAVDSDFNNNAISCNCSVIAKIAGDSGASRGKRGGGLLSPVLSLADEGFLKRVPVEDVDRPREEEVIVRRSFGVAHDDGDVLLTCDRLPGIKRVRDELRKDDVKLRGDGGSTAPRSHGRGELGCPGGKARELRLVRPARVGSGSDRGERRRFEIEFGSQRGIPPCWTLAWNCGQGWVIILNCQSREVRTIEAGLLFRQV